MPQVCFNNSTLYFQKTGYGNRSLLLFPGFGQEHENFKALTDALSTYYTIYSFDLFFHGNSQWNHGELPLKKEMWKEIILRFLRETGIDKFNALGFSMGCKFALATLELFPRNIEYVYLLAPDGIRTSFWYNLATQTLLARKFFKSMILKPGRFYFITSILKTLHLLDKYLLRFTELQMETQEKRERVYYSWVVFRHLNFDMKKIATMINDHGIQLIVIIGKNDKVIPIQNMQFLLRYLPKQHLHILDTGHHGVINRCIPAIIASITR